MSHDHRPHRSTLAQAGVTLVEALVALLIMSFGMLALMGIRSDMRRSADLAKQRGEAIRLAQSDLESLRSFSTLQSYSQIVPLEQADAGAQHSNASFHLSRKVVAGADDGQLAVQVSVTWLDRSGAEIPVTLGSFIARADPRLSGSLAIAPDGAPTRRPLGRDISIPPAAKDVGEELSIFKPPASGHVAWVFSNLSGKVVKHCTGLPEGLSVSDMTLATIATYCNTTVTAYPLSGTVRFSSALPPNPESPGSAALPLDMTLTLSSAGHPSPAYECFDNAPSAADLSRTDGVSFHCLVYPSAAASPAWDGVLRITGLTLSDGGHKVCRYSADYDRNGTLSNAEHPFGYTQVTGPLTRQNFLVIPATQTCPAGQAADPQAGRFFNSATQQHQP